MRRALWAVALPGLAGVGLILRLLLPSTDPVLGDIPLVHPLPEGALRITVFGTSLSAPPQIWPDRLAQRLETCRKTPVMVTRVAGPGMGSAWGLGQVARVVQTAPDLLLTEFAVNDADLRNGISLSRAQAQHRALLDTLQTALPKTQIALMTMNPAYGLRGWARPQLNAHYAAYRDLATAAGVGLVDIHARWRGLSRVEAGLQADGLHPDPETAAGVILDALGPYLGCSIPS